MAPKKVFLSHDSRDEKMARVLANTLSRVSLEQVELWFSSDPAPSGGFKPGQVWINEIESRLLASSIVLVLLTPNSLDRPWIYFESGFGFSNRKRQVIPLCLGIKLAEVPFPLAMLQCYEINDFESLTHLCRKFFQRLRVRFDDEMSSRIVRGAAKTLNSLARQAKHNYKRLDRDVRSLNGQLEICLEMLSKTWEDLPIPVHKINETGVICGVNKKWLEVFGYNRKEVIGKPADFLMTSESAELAMLLVIPEFWDLGFAQKVCYQYKKKNGKLVSVVLNCVATTDHNGVRNSLSFVQPIDDDLTLREVREESNARYNQKLSQRSIGFYEMDLFGAFISANDYLSQMLGFVNREHLLGKNFRDVVDSSAAKKIFNACHLMYTNRIQKNTHTWEIRRRDGKTLTVRSTTSLITLSSGKAVGFRGTVQVVDSLRTPGREVRKPQLTLQTNGSLKRNGNQPVSLRP